ncbi:MAG TPA: DUF3347 domain-containing protein [Pedobacter sp.]|jgi:hypothetical protein
MNIHKLAIIGLASMFAITTACTSGTKDQKAADHETKDHEAATGDTASAQTESPKFKDEKITAVYQHYIHLKSALVKSDVKEAQAGATALNTALTDAGNKKAAGFASAVAASSDIKVQRASFDELTAEVETAIKTAGMASGKVYKQYCPMAKDGEGAYWLASESEINNPYYGEEMLKCGEVKEEIH